MGDIAQGLELAVAFGVWNEHVRPRVPITARTVDPFCLGRLSALQVAEPTGNASALGA